MRTATNQHFNNQNNNREGNLDHKTMVKCNKCDLYILESEAVMSQGKAYCGPEHARDATR